MKIDLPDDQATVHTTFTPNLEKRKPWLTESRQQPGGYSETLRP